MTNRAVFQVVGFTVVLAGCSKSSAPPPSTSDAAPAASPSGLPGPAKGTGVTMRGYNLRRTGTNLEETFLTPALVASPSFGKLYCQPVDDELYASLLYVPGVDIKGKGKHDTVYALTVNNSIYAFDALAQGSSLWERHYTDEAMGVVPVPTSDLAKTTCGTYKDISHNVGIMSTPALDLEGKTMYFVARTKENNAYFQRLHAIDLGDGSERPGSPVEIKATMPGTGAGSVDGMIAFDPLRGNQRPGLLLHQGLVYIAWSSHCDEGPYHGWVLGYDAKSLTQQVVWSSTPNGGNGGIWMSGQAPAVDDDGNIYLITGNGSADLMGGPNRGESFLKLKRDGNTLAILDWFTPYNYLALERGDRDLGASGAVLIPGTNVAMGGSKEGKLYVFDRGNLGKFNAAGDTQIMQSISVTGINRSHIHGTPVYWKSSAGESVYVMAEEDYLKQLTFNGGHMELRSMSALRTPFDPGPKPGGYTMPGGVLALSADGDKAATGVLWATTTVNKDSNQAVVPGILRAYDATDVGKDELWNSERNPRDSFGTFAKFNPPTVYNGRVYVPTFSKQYCVYSKLP
jgi:hypothetical protein